MRALRVQDRLFVTQSGRHGHEKGLTFIRVRAWVATAPHVHDRLFVTQAETRKRFDIYKSGGYGKIPERSVSRFFETIFSENLYDENGQGGGRRSRRRGR